MAPFFPLAPLSQSSRHSGITKRPDKSHMPRCSASLHAPRSPNCRGSPASLVQRPAADSLSRAIRLHPPLERTARPLRSLALPLSRPAHHSSLSRDVPVSNVAAPSRDLLPIPPPDAHQPARSSHAPVTTLRPPPRRLVPPRSSVPLLRQRQEGPCVPESLAPPSPQPLSGYASGLQPAVRECSSFCSATQACSATSH